MSSGWQDMFEQRGGRPTNAAAMPPRYEPDALELESESANYRPWTLQRGRSRPTLMLELRRYEPRSGLWSGWHLSYPSLLVAEYTGDRLLSLDFGSRQFVIEGRGLDELGRQLQQGSVVTIQEYAPDLWPNRADGPVVSAIRKVAAPSPFDA